MQSKYVPPIFKEAAFHCPICQVFARQDWDHLTSQSRGGGREYVPLWSGQCSHCDDRHYWSFDAASNPIMVVPEVTSAPPAHPMMPLAVRADYEEASGVLARSPRSAAALLRLALQKLLIELGMPGKKIDADIKQMVADGLSPLVQKALDVCRVIGNEAVHPGELDLQDTPELAAGLFEMLNFIVSDRIERPAVIEEIYGKIPPEKRQWIEERDRKARPQAPDPQDAP